MAALAIVAGAASHHLLKVPPSPAPASRESVTPAFPGRGVVPDAAEAPGAALDRHEQLASAIDRALAARDPAQRETAFVHLLPELLQDRPSMLRELFARQAPGESRDALRDELARQWIVLDDLAASAWIEALAREDRTPATQVAMRALSARSPERALAFARRFDWGFDDGSLEHLVQIWAAEHPEAAAHWIDAQPHDAWSDRLRARIEQVRRTQVSGV